MSRAVGATEGLKAGAGGLGLVSPRPNLCRSAGREGTRPRHGAQRGGPPAQLTSRGEAMRPPGFSQLTLPLSVLLPSLRGLRRTPIPLSFCFFRGRFVAGRK